MEKAEHITQTNAMFITNNKNYTIPSSRCASYTSLYGGKTDYNLLGEENV